MCQPIKHGLDSVDWETSAVGKSGDENALGLPFQDFQYVTVDI
jgi:hypothetical protein